MISSSAVDKGSICLVVHTILTLLHSVLVLLSVLAAAFQHSISFGLSCRLTRLRLRLLPFIDVTLR